MVDTMNIRIQYVIDALDELNEKDPHTSIAKMQATNADLRGLIDYMRNNVFRYLDIETPI